MKIKLNKSRIPGLLATFFIAKVLILATSLAIVAQSPAEKGVRFEKVNDQNKVDVYIDGSLFTSFRYPADLEKPFLYPVYAPNGSVITRGYPIEPRKGERIDHPHQIGLWFNHGSINGLDFWNNSMAIPADKKDCICSCTVIYKIYFDILAKLIFKCTNCTLCIYIISV